jgi:predicted Zn-dependent peptidase
VTGVDRTRLPIPGPERPFRFPRIVRHRLANGLEIRALAHRSVPVLSIALLVPGGASADPDPLPGLTSLTADLLDEGSNGHSALQVSDRVARIGGDLDIEVSADATVIALTTLERFLDPALALVHEIVTTPNLAESDFARVQMLRRERLRQMRDHAGMLADRTFARTLYGRHPYGHPTLGTDASLASMTPDDLRRFHRSMFRPEGATLVVAGDRDEEDLIARAEAVFRHWSVAPESAAADRDAALATPPAGPAGTLVAIRRPGAAQTEIRIGHVAAARSTPDYHALILLNGVLGGQFVSRVNLNLREDKGYTYGARTGFDLRRGEGPFVLQTSVGTGVTADAIREAHRELHDIRDARPVEDDELAQSRASLTLGYPRGFETAQQVARSVAQLALHDLPDTYFEEFVPRLSTTTLADVNEVARRYLQPEKMTTVLVGDLDKIGDSLGSLGLGETRVVEPEL